MGIFRVIIFRLQTAIPLNDLEILLFSPISSYIFSFLKFLMAKWRPKVIIIALSLLLSVSLFVLFFQNQQLFILLCELASIKIFLKKIFLESEKEKKGTKEEKEMNQGWHYADIGCLCTVFPTHQKQNANHLSFYPIYTCLLFHPQDLDFANIKTSLGALNISFWSLLLPVILQITCLSFRNH